MSNEIILSTGPLGGLGDHLRFSTLPERFAALGKKVYVHHDNAARNPEILDLFHLNPYILGSSRITPNAGYAFQGHSYDFANHCPLWDGAIAAVERAHGLPPPYSIAPKLYYTPQPPNQELGNAVLCDFTSISSTYGPQGIQAFLVKMMDRFAGCRFLNLTFDASVTAAKIALDGDSIRVNSIFEYIDMLAACRAWIGLESGGQSLASAVRGTSARPEVVCLITPETFNSRGYTYANVDYRVTRDSSFQSLDYHQPVEVPYDRFNATSRRSVEESRAAFSRAHPDYRPPQEVQLRFIDPYSQEVYQEWQHG